MQGDNDLQRIIYDIMPDKENNQDGAVAQSNSRSQHNCNEAKQ